MNRDSQIRMTNDEIRRNAQIRMTNPAIAQQSAVRDLGFGFLSSFVIRHLPVSDKFPSWEGSGVGRFLEDSIRLFAEPRIDETIPRRCCRHLAGSALLRWVCRQDAGSTLGFMESKYRGAFRVTSLQSRSWMEFVSSHYPDPFTQPCCW